METLVEKPATDNGALLEQAERVARLISDGHVTIMRFTTGWRVGFCTPGDREDIDALPLGATFGEALRRAIEAECGRAIFDPAAA